MVTRAVASEPSDGADLPRTLAQSAGDTGTGLVSRLGTSRTAGSWVDAEGRAVVAVTDDEAAAEVKQAGAEAKMVRYSMRDLKTATSTLRSTPKVAGTAWSVDYRSNEVVVRADSTVSTADWNELEEIADAIGGSVRMERAEGTFTTRINGAQPILSTAGRCSAGFNVTDGRRDFILTAGHCGPTGSVWFSDSQGSEQVGRTTTQSFPGDDYSLVEYANGRAGDGADIVSIGEGQGVRITDLGEASVGQRVFRSGSTSGLRDGEVTAVDATVNYPEGTVSGLIETNVCAEPGDSGGPMFSEGVALGVTSGGSGDCTSGGTTYFQPVTKALAELGMSLLVGAPDGAGQGASPAPSAGATQGAIAPGDATPGSSAPVSGILDASTLLSRLLNPRNIGPGLLVMGGSLMALVATRYIRTEQDRKAYQRYYSATWS